MNHLRHRRGATLHPGQLDSEVMEACRSVHRALGPGLVETVYGDCLALEFASRGLCADRRKVIRFQYRNVQMVLPLRADFLVENRLVVMVAAMNDVSPSHLAQLRTCIRLAECPLGLLVNFNVARLPEGIHRVFPEGVASVGQR